MFEKNIAFEHSCNIRPIKAFHPESLLEVDPNTYRRYLSSEAKQLWFHQYCAEQGMKGRIDAHFVKAEELKDIPDQDVMGGIACLVKEYWNAIVYINGEVVGTAMASGTLVVNDRAERDQASGQLRKGAISAALSQAGFGVISAFNMTQNDIDRLRAENTQPNAPAAYNQPAPAAPIGQQAPAIPMGQPVMQNSFFDAPAPAAIGAAPNAGYPYRPSAPVIQPATSMPETLPQIDPLTAAKQVVWTGGGVAKGKTLGEVLGEAGGVKTLRWIADHTPRNDAARQAKDAARLILGSLEAGR